MYFFDGCGGDVGMLGEIGVEGCGAAFLSAKDDEIWGIWSCFHSCLIFVALNNRSPF